MGVLFILEDAQVGVESVADCGSEANTIFSDELEEEEHVVVIMDEFSEQEGGSLVCVGGEKVSAAKEVLLVGVMADMQTRWEPLAAPIGAGSYVGWAALYLASYIYIYALRVLS